MMGDQEPSEKTEGGGGQTQKGHETQGLACLMGKPLMRKGE